MAPLGSVVGGGRQRAFLLLSALLASFFKSAHPACPADPGPTIMNGYTTTTAAYDVGNDFAVTCSNGFVIGLLETATTAGGAYVTTGYGSAGIVECSGTVAADIDINCVCDIIDIPNAAVAAVPVAPATTLDPATVEYTVTCTPGYATLAGETTAVTVACGGQPPACVEVQAASSPDCGYPAKHPHDMSPQIDLANMAVIGGVPVTVTCEAGWVTSGTSAGQGSFEMICIVPGRWSSTGTCDADFDECSSTDGICGANAQCFNNDGWFKCECDEDYTWDVTKTHPSPGAIGISPDVPYCIHQADPPSACGHPANLLHAMFAQIDPVDAVVGGAPVTVTCEAGWVTSGTSPGEATFEMTCIAPGTWSSTETCEADFDECSSTDGICGANAQCFNNDGWFRCECDEGYSWDVTKNHPGPGATGISPDVPYCIPTRCGNPYEMIPYASFDAVAVSEGKAGSKFTITCNKGWATSDGETSYEIECKLDPATTTLMWDLGGNECEDIDECAPGDLAACGPYAKCTNSDGGFRCKCEDGYKLDETKLVPHPDHPTADPPPYCIYIEKSCHHPTVPTYSSMEGRSFYVGDVVTFTCYEGYHTVGGGNEERKIMATCGADEKWSHIAQCEDINECEADPMICGDIHTCMNYGGGYYCSCPFGHRWDGSGKCIEITPVDPPVPVEACDEWEDKGYCSVYKCKYGKEGLPYCDCKDGPLCGSNTSGSGLTLGVILAIVAIVIIFIFIICICLVLSAMRPRYRPPPPPAYTSQVVLPTAKPWRCSPWALRH